MMELTYLNNMFSQNNSGTIYIFFRIKGWNYCTFACCSLQRMGGVAFFHKKHRWVYNFFLKHMVSFVRILYGSGTMSTVRGNFEPIPHMGIACLKLDLFACTRNMTDGSYSIPIYPTTFVDKSGCMNMWMQFPNGSLVA